MTRKVLCPKLPTPGQRAEIPHSEGLHLTQVLRLRNGETIEAIDGKGHKVTGKLQILDHGFFIEGVSQIESVSEVSKSVLPVTLEIAILKGDAMEWVIEKAAELGIQKVIPLETSFTVVQTEKKGREVFRDRWQRIADQALKQCGRLEALEVAMPIKLEAYLKTEPHSETHPRFIAAESKKDSAVELALRLSEISREARGARLMIGPEGGWNHTEIDLLIKNGVIVSLGPLILRAETAALFGMSLASSFFRSQFLTK